ncbi:MAG TPA: quercetin 2,3-dioxygenase [Thermoleophilaceae bacterium]|jgi:quercetin dioxygenase-like cupin family protein
MSDAATMTAVEAGTTTAPDQLWFLTNLVTIHVRGEDTDGRMDMLEMTLPPGDEPPLHVHHEQDECFYVLDGEVTIFLAGGEERTLQAGEFARAPRGVPHIYRAGDSGARVLTQSSPAGFQSFVETLSVPAAAPVLPQPAGPPTPEQTAHLAAVAAEHGIEILGPPGTRP